MLGNFCKNWPKWRNFTQSDHTAWHSIESLSNVVTIWLTKASPVHQEPATNTLAYLAPTPATKNTIVYLTKLSILFAETMPNDKLERWSCKVFFQLI